MGKTIEQSRDGHKKWRNVTKWNDSFILTSSDQLSAPSQYEQELVFVFDLYTHHYHHKKISKNGQEES